MTDPIFDQWTKEELTDQIRRLAEAYVPEWKFDTEHPDAGTALALIFAEMFYGNIRRCSRIPEKLKRSFFAQTGLRMLPATVAEGYVTFGLSSHEFGGAALLEGTVVIGEGKKDGDDVIYETAEPLYVTSARHVYTVYTDGQEDRIEYKDLSKPCFPFFPEERNLQEHVLYLCQNEVLCAEGDAEIGLRLLAADAVLPEEDLSWLADEKKLSVGYSCGTGFAEFGQRKLSEGCLLLKKKEGQPKPEQAELFGTDGYWIRCSYREPWVREPFLVRDIRISAKRDGIEPDLIQNGESEQGNTYFLPFGKTPEPFSECYFASKDVLGKAGARVRMTFDLDYERVPFDNTVSVEREWKMLMKRSDFTPEPEYDITVERIVWEYYNGTGFCRLPLGEETETIFNGRSVNGGSKVTLEFYCPPDAGLLEWQCAPTRYIRARVLHMNNLYRLKGSYITPAIRNVQFHYCYEGEGKHPDYAAAKNQMEQTVFPAGALERGEVDWKIFFGLQDKKRRLYLGFDKPLLRGPVKLFFATEQTEREVPQLSFEYGAQKGFLPLPVHDETGELQRSGCLTVAGREDYAVRSVCGKSAYWIRITDEKDAYRRWGERHPKIMGMYLNTVKVQAAKSRGQEGEAGNQPAGGIKGLGGSYGYVSRVTNHLPVLGGSDQETDFEAMRRGSAGIRHRGRAVTAGDYEALAREASRLVQKVKCYPNYNARGEYEPGNITLVVLMRDFRNGDMYFESLRQKITDYILPRMDGNLAAGGHLYVTEPQFCEVDCYVKAVTSDLDHVFEVQQKVKRRLEQFIHPVTGNYDGKGWEIGTVPNDAQLANALKELQEIFFIRELRSTVERVKVCQGSRGNERFAMALSGRHVVEVEKG